MPSIATDVTVVWSVRPSVGLRPSVCPTRAHHHKNRWTKDDAKTAW